MGHRSSGEQQFDGHFPFLFRVLRYGGQAYSRHLNGEIIETGNGNPLRNRQLLPLAVVDRADGEAIGKADKRSDLRMGFQ